MKLKLIFIATFLALLSSCDIVYGQTAIGTVPYGWAKTRSVDTAVVTGFFRTITVSTSNVSALVSVFSSTDTVKVCFNGDTASSSVSLVLPTWLARQYYRRVQTIQLKGTSAINVHVEVEK